MNVDLNIGRRSVPVSLDLPPVRSDDVGPFQSAMPATSKNAAAAQAFTPSRSGWVMSSIDISTVLNLTNEPPLVASARTTPLTGREFLGETIKRSRAAYEAGDATNGSLACHYTQKDLDLIRATTGCNVVMTKNIVTIVDDNGNPPPAGVADQAWRMADSIEMARISGGLTGEITPEFLQTMFDGLAAVKTPLPAAWLDRALAYLARSTDRGSAPS